MRHLVLKRLASLANGGISQLVHRYYCELLFFLRDECVLFLVRWLAVRRLEGLFLFVSNEKRGMACIGRCHVVGNPIRRVRRKDRSV